MVSKLYYHDIDLAEVGQILNARIQNVTTSQRNTLGGTLDASNTGLQVWDTTVSSPYVWSGSAWLRDAAEITGDVVFQGTVDASSSLDAQATASAGNQYVVDTAGTLSMTGVTFTPNATAEVGDVILFTSGTAATIMQRNTDAATTTSSGTVELATQTEVNTGTDNTRAITPATLANSTLASSVSTNTSNISTNTSSISTINTNIGTIGNLTTTATNLVAAINEHETQINNNDSDILSLNTYSGLGTVLGTAASNLAAAINELHGEINTNTSNISTNTSDISTNTSSTGTINTNIGAIGSLETDATNLVAAINEIHTEVNTNTGNISTNTSSIGTINTNIGTIGSLATSAGDLVGAINELHTEINTNTTNITGLDSDVTLLQSQVSSLQGASSLSTYFNGNVSLSANTAATITHNLGLIDANSFTIRVADTNGSDVSVDVDAVNTNSLTLTSLIALTGLKVTIIGF